MVGPRLNKLHLARVKKATSSLIISRYKSCVLGSGVGLNVGMEALHSQVI